MSGFWSMFGLGSGLGPLGFAAPWILALLGGLPLIWWLLRLTPPAPKIVRFPALVLLRKLEKTEETQASTPPWILIFRILLAATLILAAAGPVWQRLAPAKPGTLILAIDNSFTLAPFWPMVQDQAQKRIARAERTNSAVLVIPTASPQDAQLLSAGAAMDFTSVLAPQPFAPSRAAALKILDHIERQNYGEAVWFSDGLAAANDPAEPETFGPILQRLAGGLEMLTPPGQWVITSVQRQPEGASLGIAHRGQTGPALLQAMDKNGHVLTETQLAQQATQQVQVDLPTSLLNKVAKWQISGHKSAAASWVVDGQFAQSNVGLIRGLEEPAPLLRSLTYLERALKPHTQVSSGTLAQLLAGDNGLIIQADGHAPQGDEAQALSQWMEQGGMFLRFAGPIMAKALEGQSDPFSPVILRSRGRNLGGALSWTQPLRLGSAPDNSPLAGINPTADDDVLVQTQVLAEPVSELDAHIWARLEDGTPIVTAKAIGQGWLVLVHTTANLEWSNLALSGVFENWLKRMGQMAAGRGLTRSDAGPKPPFQVMDGFGNLQPPKPMHRAILDEFHPSSLTPPGLYGPANGAMAFNLGPYVTLSPLDPPIGARLSDLTQQNHDLNLRPFLLALAMIMLLADGIMSLWLRGLLSKTAKAAIGFLALLMIFPAPKADAADLNLAYIRTPDASLNAQIGQGLMGLTRIAVERTRLSLAAPKEIGFDPDLAQYPLIYWVILPNQPPLTPTQTQHLNAFLETGGMLVMDWAALGLGQNGGQSQFLQRLIAGLLLPPLVPLSADHTLSRSFYLLEKLPQPLPKGEIWLANTAAFDNVSPVVAGNIAWWQYWQGEADSFGFVPRQDLPQGLMGKRSLADRQGWDLASDESAFRFGINLLIYALTGNYKTDQVHVTNILKRLNNQIIGPENLLSPQGEQPAR